MELCDGEAQSKWGLCACSGSYRKNGFYDTAMVLATITSIQKTSKEKPHDPQGTSGKNK
jgi:hypothetical protein